MVQLYEEARAALMGSSEQNKAANLSVPAVPVPVAATVNRYPVSNPSRGTGSQLGFHQDNGKWRKLVVGVTLGPDDWRAMKFLHKPTRTTHKIRTEPGEVYLFRMRCTRVGTTQA